MTEIVPADVRARIDDLADDLQARGLLSDPMWREALHAVPRHLFVPSAAWITPDYQAAPGYRIDRDQNPATWWEAVYRDGSIVIQADDGAGDPASGDGMATSSLSAPGVVVQFLELLRIRPGHRVLEIGTGSGWTAALMSRVMDGEASMGGVTTIEVDADVAAGAARNVRTAGQSPHLVVGDGAAGWADGAPYDRVHVTCGVSTIPAAWFAQTRPGGLIVAPWLPAGLGIGHKLRLTVTGDDSATGTFHGPASYMMLRAQRIARAWNPHHTDDAVTSSTRLDPRAILSADAGARLAITTLASGIGGHGTEDENGAFSLLLYEVGDPEGSWAACDCEPGADRYAVTQYGDRRLWDEVSAAFLTWCSWGSPGYGRFGVTATANQMHIWLDSPGQMARA